MHSIALLPFPLGQGFIFFLPVRVPILTHLPFFNFLPFGHVLTHLPYFNFLPFGHFFLYFFNIDCPFFKHLQDLAVQSQFPDSHSESSPK